METNTLDRLTAGGEALTEHEILRAETAWSAGEQGYTPFVIPAAQIRAQAETAYEAAFERARNERSAEAYQAERDLAQQRAQARHTWRVLYLEGQRARKHAEACWETVKQEAVTKRPRRPTL
jgi:hypothetical protein